jgi:predicted aspartyl protease
MLEVYEASLRWKGIDRAVEVLASDGAPLLGMTLLQGTDVHLHVEEGGLVSIVPF